MSEENERVLGLRFLIEELSTNDRLDALALLCAFAEIEKRLIALEHEKTEEKSGE